MSSTSEVITATLNACEALFSESKLKFMELQQEWSALDVRMREFKARQVLAGTAQALVRMEIVSRKRSIPESEFSSMMKRLEQFQLVVRTFTGLQE